jgi:hypothetical protein
VGEATIPSCATKAEGLPRTATLLADVETELRHTDAADDQIGEHAADAHDTLTAEIASELLAPRNLL